MMRRQNGAALISVMFLIIVVATLGAVTVKTGMNQEQSSGLSLAEVRADAAAFAGLEYGSAVLRTGGACPPQAPIPANTPGLRGFSVGLQCRTINVPAGAVHEITATASFSAFGSPDYVQRIRTRRVSNIGAGSW